MTDSPARVTNDKLIIGCGYLGRRVAARWLAGGHAVSAVTRTAEKAEQLQQQGIRPIIADVTRSETLADLPPADTVLYSVGLDPRGKSSRWALYVDGLRAVLDALPEETRRIIAISSTGVYGQTDGSWVDEDSACHPTREAGLAFVAAEEMLAAHRLGDRAIVLRLAGLYGPGRLPRKADLLAGEPIGVPVDAFLNLIHVDDAAAVVLAVEARAKPPRTYIVSDGHPTDRRAYLSYLAELLAAPMPHFVEPSPEVLSGRHTGNNKQVNNSRMLGELDVRLAYPTHQEGLAAILDLER